MTNAGFRTVSRAGHRRKQPTSPSMEQYIETIAELLTERKVCSVSDIATQANVSKAAVSRAVRDLVAKELVEHKSYGYVDLTPEGYALASNLNARHQALFEFLNSVLHYDEALADEEACRLEHQIGDETITRLVHLTAFFQRYPDALDRWSDMLDHVLDRISVKLR